MILQQIMKAELGKDIIETYQKYRNNSTKWNFTTISGYKQLSIDQRYEVIDVIGQSAYAMVVGARDKESVDKDKNLVVIKNIDKAFEHKNHTKQILNELKLLKLLKHQNILGVDTILLPKSREDFKDIHVISELMDTDLATIIKSEQPLTDEHIQFFLYQILRGLKYIHSASVVHKDLKPRNLLINSNCDLKISNFGKSQIIFPSESSKAKKLNYFLTTWYKAPQLLLCIPAYPMAADMWSVGCILAQMLRRKPVFRGTDVKNQIQLIFHFLGTPDIDQIQNIPQDSKKFLKLFPIWQSEELSKKFPEASPDALDLLEKLLTFDPRKRINAEQALKHKYLEHLHVEQEEPTRDPIDPIDFEFQNHNLAMQQLKDIIYEEILLYHYEDFSEAYETKKKNKQSLITHILNNSNSKSYSAGADSDDYE